MKTKDIYDPSTLNRTLKVVSVDVTPLGGDDNLHFFSVLMTPEAENMLFASIHHLWACIRDTLYSEGYSTTLPIKNASRYAALDNPVRIPCIQDVARSIVIYDPLHVFRNPCVELYKKNSVTLHSAKSQSSYYAPNRAKNAMRKQGGE